MTAANTTAATRMGSVTAPSPAALSSSWAATAEISATTAAQTAVGRNIMITNRMGTKITATSIRLPMFSHTSEPTGTVLVGGDGPQQFLRREVRPEHVGKIEFRVGALPQQKI